MGALKTDCKGVNVFNSTDHLLPTISRKDWIEPNFSQKITLEANTDVIASFTYISTN